MKPFYIIAFYGIRLRVFFFLFWRTIILYGIVISIPFFELFCPVFNSLRQLCLKFIKSSLVIWAKSLSIAFPMDIIVPNKPKLLTSLNLLALLSLAHSQRIVFELWGSLQPSIYALYLSSMVAYRL